MLGLEIIAFSMNSSKLSGILYANTGILISIGSNANILVKLALFASRFAYAKDSSESALARAETALATSVSVDSPSLNFSRPVLQPSSNGTAIFSAHWTLEFAGNMRVGQNVSGVTHTIRVIRGKTGIQSYNISATANGVTFSASGSTNSGAVGRPFDIVLTASGTPTAAGNISFNSDTNPVMTFTRTINP
jgi:hypothetical protein